MEILYFLPMILFFGIVTSYEDIKQGKIRNKWIVWGFAYAFFATMLLFAITILSQQDIRYEYVLGYIYNIIISFFFGFALWHAGLWSAGDAKLFSCYAALIPLSVYSFGYVYLFPSLVILINSFLPILIFLTIRLSISTSFHQKIKILQKSFSIGNFSFMVISLFGISWLVGICFSFSGIALDILSYTVILIPVYMLLQKTLRNKMIYIFVMLSVLRIAFDFGHLISMDFVFFFLSLIVFFVLVRSFLFGMSSEFFSSPVKISELKKDMIPAENIIREGGKYKRAELGFGNKAAGTKPLLGSKYLTDSDIEKLKKLHRQGKIGPVLRIQHTIPFAPFMFLGVLITIAVQGNLLLLIKLLFV